MIVDTPYEVDFVAPSTSTGSMGGIKITLPKSVKEWIFLKSPDIVYLKSARLQRATDGDFFDLDSPRLSKGNLDARYIIIPKKKVAEHSVKVGDNFKVALKWSNYEVIDDGQ